MCLILSFALITQGNAINFIAAEHKMVILNSPDLAADYSGHILLLCSLFSYTHLTMARKNNNINVFVFEFETFIFLYYNLLSF
jgi:hypothetical protein